MTIFICSVLHNLGIPFVIRIAQYEQGKGFQHVYPIVPTENGGYFTLDAVVSEFNYEKPYITKKDFNMTTLGIPIIGLHGIPSEAEELVQGLGTTENTADAVYNHLVKTKEILMNNRGLISHIDYEPAFLHMLDYAIQHFWTSQRDEAFKQLAWNEAIHNRQAGIGELDLVRDEDDNLQGFDELDGVIDGDDLYDFDGLGRPTPKRQARKTLRKQQKAQKKILKASQTKNPKKATRKIQKAEKKIAKGFFRKAGVVLANKADKKALIKHNPIIIAKQQAQERQYAEPIEENNSNSTAENYSDSYDTENYQIQNEESFSEPIEEENINPELESEESYDAEYDESYPSDEVIEGLLGLGSPIHNEKEIFRHLEATRDLLKANPNLIPPHIDHTKGFLSMLDYSIKHFWTPERNKAMKILALNEAKINKISGISEDDLLGADDDDLDGIVDYDDVYELNGLGELGGKTQTSQGRAKSRTKSPKRQE